METPDTLRTKASRYRDMTQRVTDQRGRAALARLADKFDAFATQLECDTLRKAAKTERSVH